MASHMAGPAMHELAARICFDGDHNICPLTWLVYQSQPSRKWQMLEIYAGRCGKYLVHKSEIQHVSNSTELNVD